MSEAVERLRAEIEQRSYVGADPSVPVTITLQDAREILCMHGCLVAIAEAALNGYNRGSVKVDERYRKFGNVR